MGETIELGLVVVLVATHVVFAVIERRRQQRFREEVKAFWREGFH
jgi:hypothetical protein